MSASPIITLGNFNSFIIEKQIKGVFNQFEMPKLNYNIMFDSTKMDQGLEVEKALDNFTVLVPKPQGQQTKYVSASQRFTKIYEPQTFSLGYEVTMEAKQDLSRNALLNLIGRYSGQLVKAGLRNREIRAAFVYTNANDAAYIGPDGKPLIATDHPIDTGVQSNTLPNQSPFSEPALEALCIAAKTALDLNGNLINLETELLVIHPNLEMEAERILNSVARVATANNDLNALRARGKFPKGFITNPYLGNPNSYFIKTDAQDGLKHKERMPITIAEDSAFDSKVDKYTATFRDVFGWSNYLGLFGAGFY